METNMIDSSERLYVGVIGLNSRIVECEKWITLDFVKSLIFEDVSDNYVECVYNAFQDKNLIIICDDTGRLTYKPQNMATARAGIIHGDCLICGSDINDDYETDICGISEERLRSAVLQVMKINGKSVSSGKDLWDYMLSL